MSVGDRMEEEMRRLMGTLDDAVKTFGDDEGNPPAWMTAHSDQLHAAAAGLADVLLEAGKEHVAANRPCCASDTCVGVEMMMDTSVAFKEAPVQMIPAMWAVIARAVRAEMKVAELEQKMKGDQDGGG